MKIRSIVKKLLTSEQYRRHALVGAPNSWRLTRKFQIEFMLNHGLKKEHKFMDIGCGTLRGGIPIIHYLNSNNYYGLEVRDFILEQAKMELKKTKLESKNPHLILVKNYSELNLNVQFDRILAFSVLIHFEDEITKACFDFVGKSLKKGGVFLANVNLKDFKDGSWAGFPVVFRDLKFYKSLASNNGLNLSILGNMIDVGYDSGKQFDRQQTMLRFTKN